MPIFFRRKRTKHENARSPPFSYHTKMVAITIGVQTERALQSLKRTDSRLVFYEFSRDWYCWSISIVASRSSCCSRTKPGVSSMDSSELFFPIAECACKLSTCKHLIQQNTIVSASWRVITGTCKDFY